ncbi:hypothetical protein NEFER03_1891 [Nematocida sp. LUAm3]|nr:hypothetical protein NEFER03_1891 [Nematocida sp. LUAm3]KAI5173958.1 hypothetical protein NEFER02_0425 [Nematocida sp. LUAm2]KAI5177297.1 hypothetical protein NEFER01_0572 [Nematocida sp. LUAm1]
MESKEMSVDSQLSSHSEQFTDDLSETHKREEILKSLEEEFKKGLKELQGSKPLGKRAARKEDLFNQVYIPRRGQEKWENTRKEYIRNTPITVTEKVESNPEKRNKSYKIDLKEETKYFNVIDNHLLIATTKGVVKIYKILPECTLERTWEGRNTLFMFLIQSREIPFSVVDVYSSLLVLLHTKGIQEIEKVFQDFLLFTRISSIKRALFINGYLALISSHKQLHLFDEALMEIPLVGNTRKILSTIYKDQRAETDRVNRSLKEKKEIKIPLKEITIKVSSSKVKLIYSKKSIYEEIHLSKTSQVIYTNGVLYLKGETCIHAITFS